MNKSSLMIALLAGVSLTACQRSSIDTPPLAALPPSTNAAAPLAEAPPATALPPAPPARLASIADPRQGYAYADRAWAMTDALGDSPPDYTYVDDDGVTPWVWVADDGSECIAEAVPGGERYYYYQPGADAPYYVQDADYGYGYDSGALVVVFDRSGQELSPDAFQGRADFAGRILARGQTLRTTASSAQHEPVAASNWNTRRGVISEQRQAWSKEAESNPDWRAYHDQNGAQEQAHWSNESARRETWAAQTDARLGDTARASREQQLAAAQRPSQFGAQPTLTAPAERLRGLPGSQATLAERPTQQQQQQLARNEPSRSAAARVRASEPQAAARPATEAPRSTEAFAERRMTAQSAQASGRVETQATRAVQASPAPVRSRETQAFAAPVARAPEARAAAAAGTPAAARAPAERQAEPPPPQPAKERPGQRPGA